MATGHYIGIGDETSCGGRVLQGENWINWDGVIHSREGDQVSCGIDGKIYRIAGGIRHFTSDGIPVAGTLDSYSTCPCQARLIPSVLSATYTVDDDSLVRGKGMADVPSPAPAGRSVDPTRSLDRNFQQRVAEIEEEEEEVELEQLITLRIGVFFDGTGNNQANSESVAGCMARDVNLHDVAEEVRRHCEAHGYDSEGNTPDDSYGNDASNVARLYDLYMDDAEDVLSAATDEVSIKVYLEGIGTVSGGKDALYGQATGRHATGILARFKQSPALIVKRLNAFVGNNPTVKIKNIEFDIFGFSRGAAAARHFANDLQKGTNSLLAKALPASSAMMVDGFNWRVHRDVGINFIGLFDTVAGIVSPLVGDFSAGDARNSGLELALPAGAARKVVQLVARDEHRLNFAMTRTENDIALPGAHSDIGGGYLPRSRERLLLGKPKTSLERLNVPNERANAVIQVLQDRDALLTQLRAQGVEIAHETWSVDQPYIRTDLFREKRVFAAVSVDRIVDGDLSKVYLRVMRELGVRNQVPFKQIADTPALAIPIILEPIAKKIEAYALGESSALGLTKSEESLLYQRYIHLSANWNAVKKWKNSDLDIVFINRPADNRQRTMHPNE
jgi:type VI secretion system secreted protein VgrG